MTDRSTHEIKMTVEEAERYQAMTHDCPICAAGHKATPQKDPNLEFSKALHQFLRIPFK